MLRITLFFLIAILSLFSYQAQAEWDEEILKTKFKNVAGGKISLDELANRNTVFIMLSPECPLCRNYTLSIKKLQKAFPEYNWLGVFPGKFYNRKEIQSFFTSYNLDLKSIIDSEYILSKNFDASITPEAFLVDAKGMILYSGAIDDWVLELGKTRDFISQHYLRDALRQNLEGEMINTSNTEAIGCKIQY